MPVQKTLRSVHSCKFLLRNAQFLSVLATFEQSWKVPFFVSKLLCLMNLQEFCTEVLKTKCAMTVTSAGERMARPAFSVLIKGLPGTRKTRDDRRGTYYEIRFTLHAIRSFIASPNPYPCKLLSDKALGKDRL